MEVPFYRSMYVFFHQEVLQVEYFEYSNYTQVVISKETKKEFVSSSASDVCRKRAYRFALEQFKQKAAASFANASIGYQQIKM
ncbi:hypothetical protein [Bacillus sp. FJAT-47783]|uniref:hypothetical protein n=1 Tax=Bacillus sp. FJAT-47783 TaxID=2922712 RepID=UPI001FAE0B19|nr:hypothetical protein [Bacillus sp. FJAT-47783]